MKRPVIYQLFPRLFSNRKLTNVPHGSLAENGVGKFADIDLAVLQKLAGFGYTHIWYTGILEHATTTDYSQFGIGSDPAELVKGKAGSPYAVRDYYDVDPDLAMDVPNRMKEFEELINRTGTTGLKTIIDFVPNHLARTYRSDSKPSEVSDFGEFDDVSDFFSPANNFYYLNDPLVLNFIENQSYRENPARASGNDVFSPAPSVDDWYETVKLNYGVNYRDHTKHFDPLPDTWLKMQQVLEFWVSKGIDGFRCDMVEMVPVEFWTWVISKLRKENPEIVFIGEAYQPAHYAGLFQAGFDYLYDKSGMYDALRDIAQYKHSTDRLTHVWQAQEGIGHKMLRFIENHDEQRVASHHFCGDPNYGVPMMAAAALMHTGPVMLYNGQEFGENAPLSEGFSGENGRTSIFDYCSMPMLAKAWEKDAFAASLSASQQQLYTQYQELLQLVNTQEAFRNGSFFDLQYYNRNDQVQMYSDRLFAFLRYTETERFLIVINFDTKPAEMSIKIPALAWEMMKVNAQPITVDGKGEISMASTVEYDRESELFIDCPALNYRILQINAKPVNHRND